MPPERDAGVAWRATVEACQRDLLASDLGLVIFDAALSHFRHDSLVRPFPCDFANNVRGEAVKDFAELRRAFDGLPPVDKLDADDETSVRLRSRQLLSWLVNRGRRRAPRLRTVADSRAVYDKIQAATCAPSYAHVPEYIVEVAPAEADKRSPAEFETAFDQLAAENGTRLAFHGTAMENVYSILHNGLASHLNEAITRGSLSSVESMQCP